MTVSELISVLGVTRRSQKRRLMKLCPVAQDPDKVTILFHIDNIYVDAIFKMDSISVATIEGVKREFIAWIEELEKQIKKGKIRLCGIDINVTTTPKYSYFSHAGGVPLASLAAQEQSMNRFERILYDYLKNKASVIFNRWFILTVSDGKVAVINTPMGIYRATELIRPAAITSTKNAQAPDRASIANIPSKGNFATKIFSFGNRLKRQPAPNKVVNLQRGASARTGTSSQSSSPLPVSDQRDGKK